MARRSGQLSCHGCVRHRFGFLVGAAIEPLTSPSSVTKGPSIRQFDGHRRIAMVCLAAGVRDQDVLHDLYYVPHLQSDDFGVGAVAEGARS